MAEVLITLGIIGVVAAMTLPALISNSRNKELEAGLKRGYSLIGQALELYQASEGEGERFRPDNFKRHEIKPILMKYFRTVRDCGLGYDDKDTACVPNYGGYGNENDERNSMAYHTYNNKNTINVNYFDDGQFALNNGNLILLENDMSSGHKNIYISIDINGYQKRPNRLGWDLFMFQLDEKGVLRPMGVEGTAYYDVYDRFCSTSSTDKMNGAGCTYKALTKKDYFKNLPK